jgi:putative phosphoesterase
VRIAVIADTHLTGGRPLPPRVAEIAASCDAVIHVGDFSDEAALDAVRAIGRPLHAVHGNVESRGVMEALPGVMTATFAGVHVGLVHDAGPAHGRLQRLRKRFPDCAAAVFGHSHLPLLEADPATGFQIFNPGSPTQRRRAPTHTMGIATCSGGAVRFEHVELD